MRELHFDAKWNWFSKTAPIGRSIRWPKFTISISNRRTSLIFAKNLKKITKMPIIWPKIMEHYNELFFMPNPSELKFCLFKQNRLGEMIWACKRMSNIMYFFEVGWKMYWEWMDFETVGWISWVGKAQKSVGLKIMDFWVFWRLMRI